MNSRRNYGDLGGGDLIKVSTWISWPKPCNWQRILNIKKYSKNRYADYAVLYRSNHQAKVVEQIFVEIIFPMWWVADARFWFLLKSETWWRISGFYVIPKTMRHSYWIVNIPRRESAHPRWRSLATIHWTCKYWYFKAANSDEILANISPRTASKLKEFYQLINSLQKKVLANTSADKAVDELVDKPIIYHGLNKHPKTKPVGKPYQTGQGFSKWIRAFLSKGQSVF